MKLHQLTALLAFLACQAPISQAHEQMHDHGDNPLLTYLLIDHLEWQHGDDTTAALEGEAWIGKDLNKLWLKTDITQQHGHTEEAELQALYSRALTPFWDVQTGLLHSHEPKPTRDWAVIGFKGLTPYWFELDTALLIGQGGNIAARFKAEYELLFTQQLILTPDIELNMFGQNDVATGTHAGLSQAKAGLRLRYEICREFAPYIGVNWLHTKSSDWAKTQEEDSSGTKLVLGVHAWF